LAAEESKEIEKTDKGYQGLEKNDRRMKKNQV
jgi:hypothetical protein